MASTILLLAQLYCAIGLLVGVAFLAWGIDTVDEAAHGSWVFRPLLLPGLILLWPLAALRWWALTKRSGDPPARAERPPLAMQRWIALMLTMLVPIVIFSALTVRQDGPHEQPAVFLGAVDE